MIEIKKVDLSDSVLQLLIDFSKTWENENSCYGYRKNDIDDIKEETIYLAYNEDQPIGYLFGHNLLSDAESCTIPKGSKCFEVEELFVEMKYRSQGIGRKLYEYVENDQKNYVEYITLTTATKNAKAILHFYLDEVGMDFWYARLFKKINRNL